MAVYAVHYDWLDKSPSQVPVGLWDEHGASYYPPSTEHLKPRGFRASTRSEGRTWASHLEYLTDNSSAYNANWQVVSSDLSLDESMEAIWHGFLATEPSVEPLRFLADTEAPSVQPDDEAEDITAAEPAGRFVIAQSWWIASELARRHPELIVHEMHPGGGLYDVLALFNPRRAEFTSQTRVMLNRAGSIQVHHPSDSGKGNVRIGSWSDVISSGNAHQFIKLIEREAGLGLPSSTPPSTPRALAYRLIAAALTATVNDRHSWDARNLVVDSSDGWGDDEADPFGYLRGFPQARRDLDIDAVAHPERPAESRSWALLRDGEPVAIITVDGRAYLLDRTVELLPTYEASKRSMLRLLETAFGEVLSAE